MTTYYAKKVRGITKLRKTLNRLEPDSTKKLKAVLKWGARSIEKDAIGLAIMQDIRITGDLIHSIEYKLSNDGFTAVIGPSARNVRVRKNPFDTAQFSNFNAPKRDSTWLSDKEAQWNLMKGWWAEFGTAGPVEQDPQPFMNPAYKYNEHTIRKKSTGEVIKILRNLSQGPI